MQSAPRSPEGRARSAMVCTEVALRTALVPGRRGGRGGAPSAGGSAFSACPADRTARRVVVCVFMGGSQVPGSLRGSLLQWLHRKRRKDMQLSSSQTVSSGCQERTTRGGRTCRAPSAVTRNSWCRAPLLARCHGPAKQQAHQMRLSSLITDLQRPCAPVPSIMQLHEQAAASGGSACLVVHHIKIGSSMLFCIISHPSKHQRVGYSCANDSARLVPGNAVSSKPQFAAVSVTRHTSPLALGNITPKAPDWSIPQHCTKPLSAPELSRRPPPAAAAQ
jgi:hypothetical protein